MASIVSPSTISRAAVLALALALVGVGLAAPVWAQDQHDGGESANAWQVWGRSGGQTAMPTLDTAAGAAVGEVWAETQPMPLRTLDPPVAGIRFGGARSADLPTVEPADVDSVVSRWPGAPAAGAISPTTLSPGERDGWTGMPGTGAWGPRDGGGAQLSVGAVLGGDTPMGAVMPLDTGDVITWNPAPGPEVVVGDVPWAQPLAPQARSLDMGSRWQTAPVAPVWNDTPGDAALPDSPLDDDALAPVQWDTAAAASTGAGWVGDRAGERLGGGPAPLFGSGWTVATWTAPEGILGCRTSSLIREGNGRHRVSVGRAGGVTYFVLDSPVFQKRTRPFTATVRIDGLYSRDLRFTVQGGTARALVTDMPAFLRAFRDGHEMVLQHRGRDRAHVSLIGSSASVAALRACLAGGARRL